MRDASRQREVAFDLIGRIYDAAGDPERLRRLAEEAAASIGQDGDPDLVTPHLERALKLAKRVQDAEHAGAATRASLDRLGFGVLLIGAERDVVFANRAARRITQSADGMELFESDRRRKRLRIRDARARALVDGMLAECLGEKGRAARHGGVSVPRPSRKAPYLLQCTLLDEAPPAGAARAVVFITDLDECVKLDRGVLRRLYGITESEAELAERLCCGERLSRAATTLGIAQNTARSQLKTIFHKTGVSRQSELVRLLLSLNTSV